jgi:hypothetical protein
VNLDVEHPGAPAERETNRSGGVEHRVCNELADDECGVGGQILAAGVPEEFVCRSPCLRDRLRFGREGDVEMRGTVLRRHPFRISEARGVARVLVLFFPLDRTVMCPYVCGCVAEVLSNYCGVREASRVVFR